LWRKQGARLLACVCAWLASDGGGIVAENVACPDVDVDEGFALRATIDVSGVAGEQVSGFDGKVQLGCGGVRGKLEGH
jgi:hypothetical protein